MKLNTKIVISLYTLLTLTEINGFSQLSWPSESWESAENITPVMDPNGLSDISGLHWNPVFNRLYVVNGGNGLRVLQLNEKSTTFTQIANKSGLKSAEGITQADYKLNEFYIIDENSYRIRKYTHSSDFSSIVNTYSWNLLIPPSPMKNTGNIGPEGIAFVPDNFLSSIGFISQVTGRAYKSTKGAGGLLFIAHQSGGFIWVFDINPNVTNDFLFVGKYKTNSDESCGLEFDRSTGLLYILHNVKENTLEVTDLSSTVIGGGRTFRTLKEYKIPNPPGSNNIEGFAITPKLSKTTKVSVWLCRDIENGGKLSLRQDCVRWFYPFTE
jgi:hypothetical protein